MKTGWLYFLPTPSSFYLPGLTVSVLVLWWLQQLLELNIDMNFGPQEQGHLQQNKLQLANTCTQERGGFDTIIIIKQSQLVKDSLMWSMEPAQNFP